MAHLLERAGLPHHCAGTKGRGTLEATQKIREMGGWNGDVPIVALTAHAADRVGNEFLAAGMTGYLAKPIRRSTLLDAIHSMKKSSGGEKEMLDVA